MRDQVKGFFYHGLRPVAVAENDRIDSSTAHMRSWKASIVAIEKSCDCFRRRRRETSKNLMISARLKNKFTLFPALGPIVFPALVE